MAHRSISQAERDEFDGHPTEEPPAESPGVALRADLWERFGAGIGGGLPPRRSTAVGAVVAAVVLGLIVWWLVRPAAAPVESTLPLAGASTIGSAQEGASTGAMAAPADPSSTSSAAPTKVVVQAAGAVGRPGVYRLETGARVDDLVRQAGGFSPDADRDRVNLAAPLVDGERVWVPARGQREVPDVVAGGGGGSGGTSAGAGDGGAGTPSPAAPVDLNAATAEQLDALPGVGPATAAAILAYRAQAGRFATVDDLLEVRGIGDAKLEQLRPLVRV